MVCMYAGIIPQEIFLKLDALRLLLRSFWDRNRIYMARGQLHPIFGCPCFAKPADLEFSLREKVLQLAEQQAGNITRRTTGALLSAWNGDLFSYALYSRACVFSSQRCKPITGAFHASFPWTRIAAIRLVWTEVILSETSGPLGNGRALKMYG